MKLKPVMFLWLPVGVIALILIGAAAIASGVCWCVAHVELACDAAERRLCDWLNRIDPS